MNYVRHHWQGKLPLVLSFWVNTVVVWLCVYGLSLWVRKFSPIKDPVIAARVYVPLFFFIFIIIFSWQMVGLWRASRRYIRMFPGKIWGELVRFFVVLAVLRGLGYTFFPSPVMESRLKTGFGKDQFADYHVSLTHSGTLLRVQGPLGFGISKKVKRLVEKTPEVSGIILDSGGGWVYEGRKLATLILNHHLDTYTIKRCSSACALAFAAGKQRYLVQGATLGFHQSQTQNKKLSPYFDQRREQEIDRNYYLGRGIKPAFVEQIFKTGPNDIWYPDMETLMASGMVHVMLDHFGT